jgi:TonB family protein
MVFGTGTSLQLNTPPEPEVAENSLDLLPAIEPWSGTFLRNLKDFLLLRDWPTLREGVAYDGWRTNFVLTNAPWTRIRESWWGHGLIAAVTVLICTSTLFLEPPVKAVNPFEHAHIQYYPTSDYLPPINSSAPRPHSTKKADPVFAKQEIISVRAEAANHTQTIITPPKVKLQHDVALPNMAVWTSDPVAPTAAAPAIQPKMVFSPAAQVVEPTPDVNRLRDKRSVSLQASAVEPIANDQSLRRAGQINLAPDVVAPAPSLPMPSQRASGLTVAQQVVPPTPNLPTGAMQAGANGKTVSPGLQPQVVPPAPSVGSVAGSGKATGQIIALSVKPADVRGPISIPAGNRNGEFAAGPNGKPGASGQPESSSSSSGNGAGKTSGTNSGPAGVYVAAPPTGAGTAPVVGTQPQPAPTELAKLQFPKMQHTTVADLAKATKPVSTPAADRSVLADKYFGMKRYYSLTLNMPNLNSATGSWVVRFAELQEKRDGVPLMAPEAINKLDPIYPQELARDHVEGTVTLYAVIHRDGSVGDIKVVKSVDKLLDYAAMRALSGWRFLPGMKNGAAVDLEAIVDIPFKLKAITPY